MEEERPSGCGLKLILSADSALCRDSRIQLFLCPLQHRKAVNTLKDYMEHAYNLQKFDTF